MFKSPLSSVVLGIIRKGKGRKIMKDIIKEFFGSLDAKDFLDLFGGKEKFVDLLAEIIRKLDEKDKEKIVDAIFRDCAWEIFNNQINQILDIKAELEMAELYKNLGGIS